MNFGMITLSQNIKTEQNYVTWILTALLFICLFNDNAILKSQRRFKSDCRNVNTEQSNKIALSSNYNDQIRDEKLQYDINRKTAEISALSLGIIDKYEYLTDKEILPSNQQQIIEQAKLTYSHLGKAFEKQVKTIEGQGEKQIETLKDLNTEEQTKSNFPERL